MNVYTPARYDERAFHLAIGVEPRDASSGQRLTSSVDVRLELFPRPVDRWRTWGPGDTLTAALPRMHRHNSGRFARRYGEPLATALDADLNPVVRVDLRIVDDGRSGRLRIAGEGRTIVPRRVRVDLPVEADVLAAELDPALPPLPAWSRVFPFGCFPGADASLPSHATVLRGRVVRADAVTGALLPVRWARVRATNPAGDEVGWAHGDDRGEFALVVAPSPGDIVVAPSPLPVSITIAAADPPPTPDPTDPVRAVVDPLWDLPLETVTPSPTPGTEPSITGRRFLPGQTASAPLAPPQPILLPVGRETSAVFRLG